MSAPLLKPVIGATGYKVSLLRVAPGREEYVARQLSTSIWRHTRSKPVCLLKVFGRYDLCAIYKTPDFLSGPSKGGPIKHIRGANPILAFHWRADKAGSPLSIGRQDGNVWGLLFFRINEDLARSYGAKIETVLARHWHETKLDGVSLDILGTTGWAEILFIVRGTRFADVTAALGSISQQKVYVGSGANLQEHLFSAKTFSLIGIDFDLTRTSRRKHLRATLTESFTSGTGVFPVLNVTCPPGSMKRVFERAKRTIGTGGAVTFGSGDFKFTPKSGRWGKFVSSVLSLRCGLSKDLYSTSVGVLREYDGEYTSFPAKLKAGRALRMPSFFASQLRKWGPIFENRLTNLSFGLTNLTQDPLTGDCFSDLRPMIEKRLPALLRDLSPDDPDLRTFLWAVVESIAYGAEERADGAFVAIEHVEGSLSPTKGGIQRVLTAAGLIPASLFERLGRKWSGFIVSGYQNEGFSSRHEIVNLPFAHLFHPEEWCGLFHETGHAAFWDTRFLNLDGANVVNTLRRALPAGEDAGEFFDWNDLVFEIAADMFDLYFCYGRDLDFYLRNIWPYVLSGQKILAKEHFIRYFVVFAYWKHLLIPNRKLFVSRNSDHDVGSFKDTLERLGLVVRAESGSEEEAALVFDSVYKIVEQVHARFCRTGAMANLQAELDADAISKMVETVLRGEVWLGGIERPDTFILALKKRADPLPLSSRLAAIISLWHAAKVLKP